MCVFNCVQHRNSKREGLGPIWAVVPEKHLITQLVIPQNKENSSPRCPRALKEGLFKIRVILQYNDPSQLRVSTLHINQGLYTITTITQLNHGIGIQSTI